MAGNTAIFIEWTIETKRSILAAVIMCNLFAEPRDRVTTSDLALTEERSGTFSQLLVRDYLVLCGVETASITAAARR